MKKLLLIMCMVFSASHIMIKADDTIDPNNDNGKTIFSNQKNNEQLNNNSTNIVTAKKEENNNKTTINEWADENKKIAEKLMNDSPVEILAAAAVFGAFFPKLTLVTAAAALFLKYKEHPEVQGFISTVKSEYSATFNTSNNSNNNDQSSTKKD